MSCIFFFVCGGCCGGTGNGFTVVWVHCQVGQHNAKRESWGHALIIDPWGVVLADAGGASSESESGSGADGAEAAAAPKIITARLDVQRLAEVKKAMAAGEVVETTGGFFLAIGSGGWTNGGQAPGRGL